MVINDSLTLAIYNYLTFYYVLYFTMYLEREVLCKNKRLELSIMKKHVHIFILILLLKLPLTFLLLCIDFRLFQTKIGH